MAINTNIINSLIQGTRKLDPRLADLLTLMNTELVRIANEVDPPPIVFTPAESEDIQRPLNIQVFDYILTGTSIILFWEAVEPGFLMYEIRTNSSSFSDGNTITRTPALSIILDPNDSIGGTGKFGLIGDRVYTLKSFNQEGEDSPEEAVLTVTIPALGPIVVTSNVINNQVILTWTEPTSTFDIDYYEIYKDDVLVQNNIRGTFFVIQEIIGGTFEYGIRARDIAGNASALATVTLDVNGPADYEVQNDIIDDFSGVKINCVEENNTLLACVNDPEQYNVHFTSRFWNTPQNQINAGFPIFIQPAADSGSYKQVIDFGTLFSNNILSYSWQFETVVPSVGITVSTRYSTDAVVWSSPIAGTQIFLAGPLRYIEVTLSFVSS